MASSRRQSAPSVSLFPFLAVMVCAMGALIFLLVITTRRIREQTVAGAQLDARIVDQSVEPDSAVPPVPAPVIAPSETRPPIEPAPPEPEQPWLPLPERAEESPPQPDRAVEAAALAEAIRKEWQATVDALSKELDGLLDTASAYSDATDRELAELAETEALIAKLERREQELRTERETIDEVDRATEQRLAELTSEIRTTENELKEAREAQAAAETRYRILPYDGRLGTVRRPIIIECTETGLTFASEEITLTPEQLNGFPPIRNPLRAGADALINYWTAKDFQERLNGESAGQPYVLLVVRPRGTVAYYVARRLLESMNSPFGYELVKQEQEFEWPETTPAAVELCRTAVDAVLRERDRLLAQTSSGRLPVARQLQFDDGEGRFYLEEVERLRGGGNTVHFGGRRWDRNAGTTGGPRVVEPATRPRVIEFPDYASRLSQADSATGLAGEPASKAYDSRAELYDEQVRQEAIVPRAAPNQTDWESAGRETGDGDSSRRANRAGPESSRGGSANRGSPQPTRRTGAGSPDSANLNPESPPFSRASRSDKIGLERDILIRVNDSAVIVENETPIQITSGISREQLQYELAVTLDGLVKSWGEPPRGFDWIPTVELEVLPGGNQYQDRLMAVVTGWGLKSRVEHVLE